MDAFEIFEGFEKIEFKLEASPNLHDCTFVSFNIDEDKIEVEFCDVENLENQKLVFTFFEAKCNFIKFSNEFPTKNYTIWDAKVGEGKNGNFKFSVWDANGNAVGFPLLLEIEFKNAKVNLLPFKNQNMRNFFEQINKNLNILLRK